MSYAIKRKAIFDVSVDFFKIPPGCVRCGKPVVILIRVAAATRHDSPADPQFDSFCTFVCSQECGEQAAAELVRGFAEVLGREEEVINAPVKS